MTNKENSSKDRVTIDNKMQQTEKAVLHGKLQRTGKELPTPTSSGPWKT